MTLLCAIPGVGPVTASAIVATVGVAGHFKSGRHFAAWLGFRIMAKAGALPREIQLRKAVKEQTRILAAAPDDEGRKQAMKKLADLQLRLDIEQEARRRFYR
ncbi:transposase IS116/IS110/IS902 family protein [Rhodobacter sp. JA431]|nr:transposase IS116/IS110/IS902 family protein [Rhodobacter sp. JA431]